MANGYIGIHVVLTPAEIARVCGWAHADRLPDDTTRALRAKTGAAMERAALTRAARAA